VSLQTERSHHSPLIRNLSFRDLGSGNQAVAGFVRRICRHRDGDPIRAVQDDQTIFCAGVSGSLNGCGVLDNSIIKLALRDRRSGQQVA